MEMTNEEIIKSYKEAKNKSRQIKILAELNCCKQIDIKKIVGVEEPKKEEKKAEKKPVESIKIVTAEATTEICPPGTEFEKADIKCLLPNGMEVEAKTIEGMPGLMILPPSVMEDAEPIRMPKVEPPESIIRLATKRLEELEETIKAAELEYKEIASFLGMGA